MTCPQCGSNGYTAGAECHVCGFNADQAESKQQVHVPMNAGRRDVLNGAGLGCSVLCFVWFFTWSIVFALVAHNRQIWSIYGPIMSVAVPMLVGLIMFLLIRQKPSSFSKGVGISLLVFLVLSLIFAVVGTKYHDNKPPANGSGNGFE